MGRVLRERRVAAARRVEHVHSSPSGGGVAFDGVRCRSASSGASLGTRRSSKTGAAARALSHRRRNQNAAACYDRLFADQRMSHRRRLFPLLTVTLRLVRVPRALRRRPRARTQRRSSAGAAHRPEFWRLVVEFSEPSGYFQSDNLVSNERPFQNVVPALKQLPRGGVYLGVAPGSELHLHRRARAAHRVHRRHPPRQPASRT